MDDRKENLNLNQIFNPNGQSPNPASPAQPQPYNPTPYDHLLPADEGPVTPPAPAVTPSQPPVPPTPPVTPPMTQTPAALPSEGVVPTPVVKVLSPRGVEYVFLTIALFTGAITFAAVLISLINGQSGFSVLSYPVAALIVSLPVFAWLFLRLKKAEVNNPALKLDASKRRSTQFTQIVAFLISFFTLIGLVGVIFADIGGSYKSSIVKTIFDVLVVEVVSGGILFYYWRDEHQRLG